MISSDPVLWSNPAMTVISCCLAVLVACGVWKLRGRGNTTLQATGVAVSAGAAALATSSLTAASHLVAMVVLESCVVVTPLCILGFEQVQGAADDVWVVIRGVVSIGAGLWVIAIIVSVHVMSWRSALLPPTGASPLVVPVGLAGGAAFWASVLRFRLPRHFRTAVVIAVLEAGALIGLAMLIVTASLPSSAAVPIDARLDQRLAGLFMMVVDLGLTGLLLVAPRPVNRIAVQR
jgi:hypothetical protein